MASGHAGLASMVSCVGLWQRDGRLVCHDAGHVTGSYGDRVAVNQWRQIHSFGKSLQDGDGFVEEDWFGRLTARFFGCAGVGLEVAGIGLEIGIGFGRHGYGGGGKSEARV